MGNGSFITVDKVGFMTELMFSSTGEIDGQLKAPSSNTVQLNSL